MDPIRGRNSLSSANFAAYQKGNLHRADPIPNERRTFPQIGRDLTSLPRSTALTRLGVDPQRVYVDHGLTGTTRAPPGPREALAAVRAGDTLVVTKLDRLARSVPGARAIANELTAREVKPNIGGSVHDSTDRSENCCSPHCP